MIALAEKREYRTGGRNLVTDEWRAQAAQKLSERGESQREMAIALGETPQSVSAVLRGVVGTSTLVESISRYLNIGRPPEKMLSPRQLKMMELMDRMSDSKLELLERMAEEMADPE